MVFEFQPPEASIKAIYGRFVKPDGSVVNDIFPISDTNFDNCYPSVDYNSVENEFLVVWQDNRDGNWNVYGVRLQYDGNILSSPRSLSDGSFIICNQDSIQYHPRIAHNYLNNSWLVVWTDYRNRTRDHNGMLMNVDIFGQRLEWDGTLLSPMETPDTKVNFPIVADKWFDDKMPDVAFHGTIIGTELNEWLVKSAAALRQLQDENARQAAELDQLKRERDVEKLASHLTDRGFLEGEEAREYANKVVESGESNVDLVEDFYNRVNNGFLLEKQASDDTIAPESAEERLAMALSSLV